jgi:hypothetical protein
MKRVASEAPLLGGIHAAPTAFGQNVFGKNVLTVASSPTGHSYLLAA